MWQIFRKRRVPERANAPLQSATPGSAAPPPGSPTDSDDDGGDVAFNGMSLSDITRGLQHAAAAANQIVAHQYTAVLQQFFDTRPDGSLQPKLVTMAMADGQVLMLPLIALMTPRGMAMERMRVELSVRTDDTAWIDEAHHFDDASHGRSRFTVSMAPRGGTPPGSEREHRTMDITLDFVALTPPEGLMRIIDEYTSGIVPANAARGKPDGDPES
ncbi:DUF2589 domain-containing protein [Chitinolyticbacter albus]|uniref:DUF2589 domain-containing protein n=1 Tax=Chitinolyticbacter albus TaxID=2961951 RepID=UPI00210B5767|nr:DUF2589 domain-containing protein [Chitinolyticbacter albus]